jgi:hypothetical protein
VEISDESFGFPDAGFPIQRSAQDLGPNLRPFVCENGTYRLVSGTFDVTQRIEHRAAAASLHAGLQPRLPAIITFVGTLDAVVTNESSEPSGC